LERPLFVATLYVYVNRWGEPPAWRIMLRPTSRVATPRDLNLMPSRCNLWRHAAEDLFVRRQDARMSMLGGTMAA